MFQCDDTRDCNIQFCPPDVEHMCSKHVEAWNKLIIKFSASSWLILRDKYIAKCSHQIWSQRVTLNWNNFYLHRNRLGLVCCSERIFYRVLERSADCSCYSVLLYAYFSLPPVDLFRAPTVFLSIFTLLYNSVNTT